MSLPMWECGLKLWCTAAQIEFAQVTPHVGVWIETLHRNDRGQGAESLPMWECGLKRLCQP